MNKIKLLVASLTLSVMAVAQSFEGSIEFKMETSKDTTTNIYYVKGKDVKLAPVVIMGVWTFAARRLPL